jgi:hypothetical protein
MKKDRLIREIGCELEALAAGLSKPEERHPE